MPTELGGETANTTVSPDQRLWQTYCVSRAAKSLAIRELLEIVLLCPTLTSQKESSLRARLWLSGDPEKKSGVFRDAANEQTLSSPYSNRYRVIKHDLPFSGMIRCGHCGRAVIGEIKKEKYIYYHCTGQHGKCP